MRSWKVIALLFCLPAIVNAAAPDSIYLQPPRSDADATHSYYVDLLGIILPESRLLVNRGSATPQERSMQLLDRGAISISWSGTNTPRETRFRPVRVPLYAGLLGIRMPVIRASDKRRFDEISNESDLKAMVACQGDQWPDSDILEANGYTVERITSFEQMYRMLEGGRCDYFPRAITEIYGELESNTYPDLMAYDRVLLSYTFPMYFFTSKNNEALARKLEERLLIFAESGDLQAFIRQHPVTKSAFPLARFSESLIFSLKNPDLPAETPLQNRALWMDVPSERHSQTDTKTSSLAGDPILYE